MAEALIGKGDLNAWGRLTIVLERPSAAILAKWSTSSLPRMLL